VGNLEAYYDSRRRGNSFSDMGSTPISILAAAPRKIMERAVPARIARKKERIKG